MNKKILVFILFFLILIVGVVFYWNKQQEELIEVNKNLPEKIKVTKTLAGKYKIENQIDNYSFIAPEKWGGIKYLEYINEEKNKGYIVSTIEMEGKTQETRYIMINKFKNNYQVSDLKSWANKAFEDFGISHDFKIHQLKNKETVVTRENPDLINMDVYFFQENGDVYSIMGGSPKFIEEIITNGKW